MTTRMGLVADIDLCMGCFACEIACKQENKLPDGKKGIDVVTLGPYEINGEPVMDFVPQSTEECNLCLNRITKGLRPFCAEICPTQALGLYNEQEILSLLRSKNSRFHIGRMGQ